MIENNSEKYLPLKTAAELYGYTRDHLGLMIRQNKLKGVKLGSYYVTTNEWMADYIKNFADPDHPVNKNKFSNRFLKEALLDEEGRMELKSEMKLIGDRVPKVNQRTWLRKAKPVVSKSIDESLKTDLQSEILKEVSRFYVAPNEKNINTDPKHQKDLFPAVYGLPYVILPIRKMNDSERNGILNRSRQENSGNDISEVI